MPNLPVSETKDLLERVHSAFAGHFHGQAELVVRAPGRVNLIGEHTDYNEGFVLPMAIDRAVWIALRPRRDRTVIVHSLDFNQTISFQFQHLAHENQGWAEYIKGVTWSLLEAGYDLCGWEGVMAGNVPIGSGLSSSAATELAVARAFAHLCDLPWQPKEMALISQKAENQWVGVNCGIMDQLISAAGRSGHAMFIDCRTLALVPTPVPDKARIVVLYSAAPRTLAASAYNQRRAECEAALAKLQPHLPHVLALRDVTMAHLTTQANLLEDRELRRARHVVSENERVRESVEALQAGDLHRMGALMVASHTSLRDDYEVSSRELDLLVELALAQPGVFGARLTGAGFGGCAIALAACDGAEEVAKTVIATYRHETGLPGEAFVTTACTGAEVI